MVPRGTLIMVHRGFTAVSSRLGHNPRISGLHHVDIFQLQQTNFGFDRENIGFELRTLLCAMLSQQKILSNTEYHGVSMEHGSFPKQP